MTWNKARPFVVLYGITLLGEAVGLLLRAAGDPMFEFSVWPLLVTLLAASLVIEGILALLQPLKSPTGSNWRRRAAQNLLFGVAYAYGSVDVGRLLSRFIERWL